MTKKTNQIITSVPNILPSPSSHSLKHCFVYEIASKLLRLKINLSSVYLSFYSYNDVYQFVLTHTSNYSNWGIELTTRLIAVILMRGSVHTKMYLKKPTNISVSMIVGFFMHYTLELYMVNIVSTSGARSLFAERFSQRELLL